MCGHGQNGGRRMSDSSNFFSPVNLEFLRKEAKAMLRQCRSGDPATLSRLRAQLPRLESEVRLADVQHALARESGYASWAELKQYSTKSRPDYTRPGSEGVLPAGFKEWVCSATYTVRPEILSPLPVGRIYRVMAGVNRPVSSDKNPITFADVYRRATPIVKNRVRELRCVDQSRRLHTWIQAHAWFPGKVIIDSADAFVTMGVLYPGEGDEIPRGERAPTADELRIAGGLTPERFTPETKIPYPEEALVDFDHADR